jgi:hypothetical protein
MILVFVILIGVVAALNYIPRWVNVHLTKRFSGMEIFASGARTALKPFNLTTKTLNF